MCTLVVLNEQIDGYPLIIAANRDERYDRRSQAPVITHFEDNDFIRPWDDEKDGTWMGVARDGWFVGITNQDDGRHEPDALSRGKVVSDCLYAGNHCGAAKVLKSLELKRYNPFNMVFGRPGAMFLTRCWDGHEMEMEPLPKGVNVISNDCWGTAYDAKLEYAKMLTHGMLEGASVTDIDNIVKKLLIIMSNHRNRTSEDPFQSLCVHAEERAFGTRSTSIITVSNDKVVEYWYTDGHPCQHDELRLVGRLEPVINNGHEIF